MFQFNITYLIPSYVLKMLCLMNVCAYIYGLTYVNILCTLCSRFKFLLTKISCLFFWVEKGNPLVFWVVEGMCNYGLCIFLNTH